MHEVAAEKCKACGKDEQAEEHEIKAERHERKANDHKGKMEDDQMDKTGAVETKDAGVEASNPEGINQYTRGEHLGSDAKTRSGEASQRAAEASKEANKSGKAEDHKEASRLHTEAAHEHYMQADKDYLHGARDASAKIHMAKHEAHRAASTAHNNIANGWGNKASASKSDLALAAKAEAGHIKLDCASKDSNKLRTILPTEEGVIMYMPAGVHTITPSQAGRPINVSVLVNEKSAKVLESQRKTLTANGKKPFFSVMHATEIAAFWPTKFFWDKRIDATGSLVEGVWAEGEWTKSGKESVEGKDFRTFSPTFHVDAVRDDPENPSIVVDASEYAAANMGALENDPAFQEMSPLWCKDASTKAVKEVLTELKAGGCNPTLKELCSAVYNKHKIILSPTEVADKINAGSFGITDKAANPVYYAGQIKAKAAHASHAAFMATAHAYTQDKDGADGDHHNSAAALHAAAQAIHEEGHKAASEAGMDDDAKGHHEMHKEMHGLMAKHHGDMHE
jgi:hypothetical protein